MNTITFKKSSFLKLVLGYYSLIFKVLNNPKVIEEVVYNLIEYYYLSYVS